jgi:spore germination protein GerM
MMRKLLGNRPAIKLALLLTPLVVLAIWFGNRLLSPPRKQLTLPVTTSAVVPSIAPGQNPTKASMAASQPQTYWLRSAANKIVLVAKPLPPQSFDTSSPQQMLTSAMQKLLSSPANDNLSSTIPVGTKLRSLQVRSDGVHIDLSQEFRSGGGSTSIIYRVAQIIYTASSLNPDEKIFISVEGQSIDKERPLGGEGLILSQPTTRSQFAANFSLDP